METALGSLLILSILKLRHKMHLSEKTQSNPVAQVEGKLPVFSGVQTHHSVKTHIVFSAWYVLYYAENYMLRSLGVTKSYTNMLMEKSPNN